MNKIQMEDINVDFLNENHDERGNDTHIKVFKVLIADDEKDVHQVTTMTFKEFDMGEIAIDFLHAYSEGDVKAIFEEHSDIAVVLLDIVMDSEDSGLKLINYIRNDKKDHDVRIILRTGHPGIAPNYKIVREYDINDYKSKTELTVERLFTSIYAAIRNYRDIKNLKRQNQIFQQVLNSTSKILNYSTLNDFYQCFIEQLEEIFNHKDLNSCIIEDKNDEKKVIAGVGLCKSCVNKVLDKESRYNQLIMDFSKLDEAMLFNEGLFVVILEEAIQGTKYLICEHDHEQDFVNIVQLYMQNAKLIYDKLLTTLKKNEEQRHLLLTLGEIIEKRDMSVSNHVVRVSKFTDLIAKRFEFSEDELYNIELASSIHDIGKIVISDVILNKPGKLTTDEFELIKKHTLENINMFKFLDTNLAQTVNDIVKYHHENWDGNGYPFGISGEAIPFAARIVTVADVFDALTHSRPYKEAWPLDEAFDYISKQASHKFDPKVVKVFIDLKEEIIDIYNKYPE